MFFLAPLTLVWVYSFGEKRGIIDIAITGSLDNYLRALDPADGRLLAEIRLPGNATGSPMTFLHRGRQLIVLPIGGGRLPAELVALGLP